MESNRGYLVKTQTLRLNPNLNISQCVISGKWLNFSVLQFIDMIVSASKKKKKKRKEKSKELRKQKLTTTPTGRAQ